MGIVAEDLQRILLMRSSDIWVNPSDRAARGSFQLGLDSYKYAMHHALRRAETLPDHIFRAPKEVGAERYQLSFEMLHRHAAEYAEVTRIFASAHENSATISFDDAALQANVTIPPFETSYSSLELLGDELSPVFSPIPLLGMVFNGPEVVSKETGEEYFWGETIQKIVDQTRVKSSRISYTYVTDFARDLFESMLHGVDRLPEAWQFPWGSAKESALFCIGLQTTVFYHLVSIHFAAVRHKITGGGVDQLLITLSKKQFVDRISRASGLAINKSSDIFDSLTYGNSTNNPDPALQPILRLDSQTYTALPLMFLSSSWPRNLLSLHARTDSPSFDKQSAIFEVRMIASLRSKIKDEFHPKFNIRVAGEEIDLLLVDEGHQTVLVCELRWVLQPGDPREVFQKRKALQQKVKQVGRKRLAIANAEKSEYKKIHQNFQPDWTIKGIVVVDGYGGCVSDEPLEYPIVPKDVFAFLIDEVGNLTRAHAMLCTPDWLPRDGVNFEREIMDSELCGVRFLRPVMRMKDTPYLPGSLSEFIAEMEKKTLAEIQRIGWSGQA